MKDQVPEIGFLGTKIQPKIGLKASLTMFFGMLVFEIFHNENIKKNFLKSISPFQKMKSWFRVLDRSSLLGSQIVNYFCIKQQFEFFFCLLQCMNLKVSFKIGAKIKITYLLIIDLFEILQIRTCANI